MLLFPGAVPHGPIGKAHAANSLLLADAEPYLEVGQFLLDLPTGVDHFFKASNQRFARGMPLVDLAALLLHNQPIARGALGLGPDGMMKTEKFSPVGFLGCPALNEFKVRGPACQFIGAPGQKKNILDRLKPQQAVIDLLHPENHHAGRGFDDLSPELFADFGSRHRFKARGGLSVASGCLVGRPARWHIGSQFVGGVERPLPGVPVFRYKHFLCFGRPVRPIKAFTLAASKAHEVDSHDRPEGFDGRKRGL